MGSLLLDIRIRSERSNEALYSKPFGKQGNYVIRPKVKGSKMQARSSPLRSVVWYTLLAMV